MPRPPIPASVQAFLRLPNPAVIATIRPDGTPHTAATWYEWDGSRALVNMDEGRLRLGYLRRRPAVSLTVLDGDDWYRHVTLMGDVQELVEDAGLVDVDRLSVHYRGRAYHTRDRCRVSARIEVTRWYGWHGSSHLRVEET